jgi:hypothetical protein
MLHITKLNLTLLKFLILSSYNLNLGNNNISDIGLSKIIKLNLTNLEYFYAGII